MAYHSFDQAKVLDLLDSLSCPARAAFAAACAERLLPFYSLYSSQSEKGDPAALQSAISALWADLLGSRLADTEIERHAMACLALVPPEDEEPWIPEQALADDAAAAATYALRCRLHGRSQDAALAARRAYEALDHFVMNSEDIDLNDPGAEELVLASVLIQQELGRQLRDLHDLRSAAVTLQAFRDRSRREAPSFLITDE